MNNNQSIVKQETRKAATIGFLAALIASLLLGHSARAEYSISRQSIASGGGKSVGGNYQLRATIGQPAARQIVTAGNYKLAAGFWSVAVIQVADAPTLKMNSTAAGYVTLSWETAASGWVLQETASLSSPAWVDCASGSSNPVTLPATGPMKFFRLHKP